MAETVTSPFGGHIDTPPTMCFRCDQHVVAEGRVAGAKAKARGYRSTRNLKAIIYLIAGKLDLALPT